MRSIVILYLFCINLYAQVAPFKIPYDIPYEISINLNNSFKFKDLDRLEISKTDDYVWQKTFNLSTNERIVISIENNIACNGVLFLKNSRDEISGPYRINEIKKQIHLKLKY